MAEPIPCDECGKEATVHLTQIVNHKVHKVDLCEACAKAKGLADADCITLADLLAKSQLGDDSEGTKGPACEACGFTPADFKRTGRLGCSRCYGQFRGLLSPLLAGMHRGAQHRGKVPDRVLERTSRAEREAALEEALAAAIRDERYEEAAVLRDELRREREPVSPTE